MKGINSVSYTTSTIVRWVLVVVWCGIIFYLSHQPGLASSFSFDFILRKLAHVFEYTVLFILLILALRRHGLAWTTIVGAAVVFSLFYAVFDELHQSYIPMRNASMIDVGIDGLGIVLGVLMFSLYKQICDRS